MSYSWVDQPQPGVRNHTRSLVGIGDGRHHRQAGHDRCLAESSLCVLLALRPNGLSSALAENSPTTRANCAVGAITDRRITPRQVLMVRLAAWTPGQPPWALVSPQRPSQAADPRSGECLGLLGEGAARQRVDHADRVRPGPIPARSGGVSRVISRPQLAPPLKPSHARA